MEINSISDEIVRFLLMTAMVLYVRPISTERHYLTVTVRWILRELFAEMLNSKPMKAFLYTLFCSCNGVAYCGDACINRVPKYEGMPDAWTKHQNFMKIGVSEPQLDSIVVRVDEKGNPSQIRMTEHTVITFTSIIEALRGGEGASKLLIHLPKEGPGALMMLKIPKRDHLVLNIFTELEERLNRIFGAQPIFNRICEVFFKRIRKHTPGLIYPRFSKPTVGPSVIPLYTFAAVAPTPASVVRSGSYPSTANVAPLNCLSYSMQHPFAAPGGLLNAPMAGNLSLPTPAPVVGGGSYLSIANIAPLYRLSNSMQHPFAAPGGPPNTPMAGNLSLPTPAPVVGGGSYLSISNIAPLHRLSNSMQHPYAAPGGPQNTPMVEKPSLPTPAPVVRIGSHPSTSNVAPLDFLSESMQIYPAIPRGVENVITVRNPPSPTPSIPVNFLPYVGSNGQEPFPISERPEMWVYPSRKTNNRRPSDRVRELATHPEKKNKVRVRPLPTGQSAQTSTRPTMQSMLDGDTRARKIRRVSRIGE